MDSINKKQTKTTHFGYQRVDETDKAAKVGEVFHSVADSYDIMNDLMSFGIHRLWKRFTIGWMKIRPGQQVLDLAGGTGDLALKIAPIVGDSGHVFLSDINSSMLALGRDRLLNAGFCDNVTCVEANAECLPFQENQFDRIIIGFGLRNVTDKQKALESMYKTLKPGGSLFVLEFSKPTTKALAAIYDKYSFSLLPKIGEWVAKDKDSYQYLAESIRMHPDQKTLKNMMEKAGLERVDYLNLTGGVVAVHRGYKL